MRHFYWVAKGALAASEKPGLGCCLSEDLEFLKKKGIGAIVSLTEDDLDGNVIRGEGFEYFRVPIEDFTAPTQDQVDEFLGIVKTMKKEGKPTLVHCHAGLGRTGTMAACYLVAQGMNAPDAIKTVRAKRPGSIELEEQEEAVHNFERRKNRNP